MTFRTFILSTLLIPAVALAHSGAKGVVMERMEGMKSLGGAMKIVKSQLGDSPDPAALREAADLIRANAGDHMTSRFPPGSMQDVSEAAPAIWEDFESFSKIAASLATGAERLEDFAIALETDATPDTTLQELFAGLGGTCKSCHADFRIKK